MNRPDSVPKRTKPNYLYAVVSVALVLFLLGFFGLLLLYLQNMVINAKEHINILVEIEPQATQEQKEILQQYLQQRTYLKPTSLDYISKEMAAEELEAVFEEDLFKANFTNPLYDVFVFNVQAQYLTSEHLSSIKNNIKDKFEFVNDLFYQDNVINTIAKNLKKVGWLAFGMGLFFLIVAFSLIHNTIRLALYANRFLIKNMELVGASWNFITRPYLVKSIKHGLLSAIIAISALILTLWFVHRSIPELNEAYQPLYVVLLFTILTIVGIIITTGSTYFAVNKYLQMRIDDLY